MILSTAKDHPIEAKGTHSVPCDQLNVVTRPILLAGRFESPSARDKSQLPEPNKKSAFLGIGAGTIACVTGAP